MRGDRERAREAALAAGFLGPGAIARHPGRIDAMIDVVIEKMRAPGPFDFGARDVVEGMRDEGMTVAADREAWHIPPADILFAQRKITGAALLAARMNARIDMRSLFEFHAGLGPSALD
jgi:hypothetical protein